MFKEHVAELRDITCHKAHTCHVTSEYAPP